jgi:hypothetical protein
VSERDERTPTTEQVRSKYATVLDEQAGWKWSDALASDFDRWLKQERAERDRLRAVVNAARGLLAEIESTRRSNDPYHVALDIAADLRRVLSGVTVTVAERQARDELELLLGSVLGDYVDGVDLMARVDDYVEARLAVVRRRVSGGETGCAQDDLAVILRALGLGDHARTDSPHTVVMNEVIPRIEWMRITEGAEAYRVRIDGEWQVMHPENVQAVYLYDWPGEGGAK